MKNNYNPYKKETVRANGIWQGMNWIRQDKRLAIYLRDGLACVYCGATAEQGTQFELDHVHAGSTNHQSNLVTACKNCNTRKADRPVRKFASQQVMRHVHRCTARQLTPFRTEAKKLI